MTSDIWKQVVIRIDRNMEAENCRIMLVFDNASCHHTKSCTLKFIQTFPVLPNVTSLIQLLNQGIIRAAETYWRSQLIKTDASQS